MAAPCGNLGVCLPDGNSYKCKCSDGKTIRTSCTVPTSSIPVMPSTTSTIVPTILSTIIITTTIQESFFHTMSPIPSPSKIYTHGYVKIIFCINLSSIYSDFIYYHCTISTFK